MDTGDKENEGLESAQPLLCPRVIGAGVQGGRSQTSMTPLSRCMPHLLIRATSALGVLILDCRCTINSVSKKTPNPKGDSETQTDPIVRVEDGAQTHWTSSVEDGSCKEVQTDTVEQVMTEATATQSEEESKLTMPEELPLDVTDFIHRVLPSVEDALQENLLSHAYSSLEIGWGDSSQFEAVVRHRLKDRNAEDQVAIEAAAVCQDVTAVSFNSSGNTLAVAYGDLKQQGWCDVQSCISVWRMHELHQKTEVFCPNNSFVHTTPYSLIAAHLITFGVFVLSLLLCIG